MLRSSLELWNWELRIKSRLRQAMPVAAGVYFLWLGLVLLGVADGLSNPLLRFGTVSKPAVACLIGAAFGALAAVLDRGVLRHLRAKVATVWQEKSVWRRQLGWLRLLASNPLVWFLSFSPILTFVTSFISRSGFLTALVAHAGTVCLLGGDLESLRVGTGRADSVSREPSDAAQH